MVEITEPTVETKEPTVEITGEDEWEGDNSVYDNLPSKSLYISRALTYYTLLIYEYTCTVHLHVHVHVYTCFLQYTYMHMYILHGGLDTVHVHVEHSKDIADLVYWSDVATLDYPCMSLVSHTPTHPVLLNVSRCLPLLLLAAYTAPVERIWHFLGIRTESSY